jgi:hypothetical protein
MNGIPILDSIPVNWFILGTSVLAGVILFLILTQIPDDEEDGKMESIDESTTEEKSVSKKKSSKK